MKQGPIFCQLWKAKPEYRMEIASVDSARAKGSLSPWEGTRNLGCNNAYSPPLQVPSDNEVAKGQKKCVCCKRGRLCQGPCHRFHCTLM